MKRMIVVELYLPGYVPGVTGCERLRRWLGLEAGLFCPDRLRKLFGPLVERYVLTGLEYEDGAVTTDADLFIGQVSNATYMKDAGFVQLELVKAIIADDQSMVLFAEAMAGKYRKTDEHPVCAYKTWVEQITKGTTRHSYWDWVCEEVERLGKPGVDIDARLIVVKGVRRARK